MISFKEINSVHWFAAFKQHVQRREAVASLSELTLVFDYRCFLGQVTEIGKAPTFTQARHPVLIRDTSESS